MYSTSLGMPPGYFCVFHVGKPVALAYLNGATDGDRLRIDIARTMFPATFTKAPAFNPTGILMQPAQQ